MILNLAVHLEQVGENGFLLTNTETNETFRIGLEEGLFLQEYRKEHIGSRNLEWSNEKRRQAEKFFASKGLLVDEDMAAKTAVKKKKQFNITKIKLFECTTEHFFEKNQKIFFLMTNRVSQVLYLLLIIGAALLCIGRGDAIQAVLLGYASNSTGAATFPISDTIVVYMMLLITMFLHEIAHMIMCERAGGKAGKAGIMLYFLQPALYCNLNSLYTIEDRRKKIQAFMAGVYSQWITSSIAVVVYFVIRDCGNGHADFLILYALLNFLVSLYNLIPFTKLDGYWILGVLWNIQNLYSKSMEALLESFHRSAKKTTKNKRKLLGYGIGAVVFYVLFWAVSLTGIYNLLEQAAGKMAALITISIIGVFILKHVLGQMRSVK